MSLLVTNLPGGFEVVVKWNSYLLELRHCVIHKIPFITVAQRLKHLNNSGIKTTVRYLSLSQTAKKVTDNEMVDSENLFLSLLPLTDIYCIAIWVKNDSAS